MAWNALCRSALERMGMMGIGASFCCSVFCAFAFREIAILEYRKTQLIASFQPAREDAWSQERIEREAKASRELESIQRDGMEQRLKANRLLTFALGLFLGGINFTLLGWGLRPQRRELPKQQDVHDIPALSLVKADAEIREEKVS